MFGGVQVPARPKQGIRNQFYFVCNDKKLYLLNLRTLKWEVVGELPQLTARAYHTATFLSQTGEP
tara:strand:+ start:90 stop:284 length:195 start_codon:yes stop_codon:yes gene_type:complete